MNKTIFAVDDEKDLQDIIKINLSKEGYTVKTFSSAEEALKALDNTVPDLILLDIMMQGMDGYEFCRKIRSVPQYKLIPVIFLSAKSEEFDKVLGLELGADDYLTKPFGMKELIARIKAVFRRVETQAEPETLILKHEGIELFPDQYQLKVDGKNVKLTKTEFKLLHLFMKHPGKVFTRDNIINSVKGEDIYIVDRTIDVHIMNLRKKLGKYSEVISTFSGVGYGLKT
jgi:two-component system, OmpR family, alkaline phosphatase synthesis response regulator PhoP